MSSTLDALKAKLGFTTAATTTEVVAAVTEEAKENTIESLNARISTLETEAAEREAVLSSQNEVIAGYQSNNAEIVAYLEAQDTKFNALKSDFDNVKRMTSSSHIPDLDNSETRNEENKASKKGSRVSASMNKIAEANGQL